MSRKFIQFQVSKELHRKIRQDCAELNISISDLMRELIKKYFNEEEVSSSEEPKE